MHAGLLRSVHNTSITHTDGADFFSNDYLGLARSDELRERIDAKLVEVRKRFGGALQSGSTGSRLLSGTHPLALELEKRIGRRPAAEYPNVAKMNFRKHDFDLVFVVVFRLHRSKYSGRIQQIKSATMGQFLGGG